MAAACVDMRATSTLLLLCAAWLGGAQYSRAPLQFFRNLTLPVSHRGHFNISDCMRELLNCWESIKPDTICLDYVLFESVCGVMHSRCSESRGAGYWQESFPIRESVCY